MWEEWLGPWVEALLRAAGQGPGQPGRGTLIDVGANTGQWSRGLASRFAQVHAFEPDERALEALRRDLPGNVTVHACAVDEATVRRKMTLFESPLHTGATTGGCRIGAGEPIGEVIVQALALDSLYVSGEIAKPVKLVKVDVEGMELGVLRGAVGLLRRERPGVLVECHELHLFALVTRLLGDLNYGFDVVRHPGYEFNTELWLGHCWVVAWPGQGGD